MAPHWHPPSSAWHPLQLFPAQLWKPSFCYLSVAPPHPSPILTPSLANVSWGTSKLTPTLCSFPQPWYIPCTQIVVGIPPSMFPLIALHLISCLCFCDHLFHPLPFHCFLLNLLYFLALIQVALEFLQRHSLPTHGVLAMFSVVCNMVCRAVALPNQTPSGRCIDL